MLAPWKKRNGQPRQHIKKQRRYFADKSLPSQGYGFSSSHVWMWKLDYKESWVLKNWCFWTVVLEKTLESPLDWRSNQSILKEINPEYSLEGLMLKLKLQYFHHLMQRTGKDPDAWKDWMHEKKGTTEDEMVGWHLWYDGHEFKQAPGVGDGQGGLAWCSPWGCKESEMPEQMNWTEHVSSSEVCVPNRSLKRQTIEALLVLACIPNLLLLIVALCNLFCLSGCTHLKNKDEDQCQLRSIITAR